MGDDVEIEEIFDTDLLSGSEDEEGAHEEEALLGVDAVSASLCGEGDLLGIAPRLDNMDIDGLGDSFDTRDTDSEDEGIQEGRKKKRQEESEKRRVAMYELLNTAAPGINLFNARQKETSGKHNLLFFSLDSLSLEADFGYARRGKLLGHGFTNDELDSILGDPSQLVAHLMPEAQTLLICDKEDYKAVMNYLFYSISVCSSPMLNAVLMRAFFDLRMHYGFRWSLTLRHVLTVLLNYGADEKVVFNRDFYNDGQVGIKKHLEEVKKSGQKDPPTSYFLPKLPPFCEKGFSNKGQTSSSLSESEFNFCLSRFLHLLADFSAGMQNYQEFRNKNDWSDQIVFLYLVLLVGSDKRLITDLAAMEAITAITHFHLDSFRPTQWQWGPRMKPDNEASKAAGFNHGSVCKTLVRILNEFFPGEGGREGVITWAVGAGGKRVTDDTGRSDHHLNMLHRLHLLPPSYRGNQVKRYLAYLYLQTLAGIPISLPYYVDLEELMENKQLYHDPAKEKEEDLKFCEGLKIIVISKNYEVVMTLVELYDSIVGQEPELELNSTSSPALLEKLRKGVLDWIKRKSPGLQERGLDEETVKKMQLSEYIDIIEDRWKSLQKI